jgi:hypothetical protein
MIDAETRTLVLGLTAAATVVLARFVRFRTVVGVYAAAVALTFLYIAFRQSSGTSPTPREYPHAPLPETSPQLNPSSSAPSVADRLRGQLSGVSIEVRGGQAHYRSVVELNETTVRIFVEFTSTTSGPLLGGSMAKALVLLRPSLCSAKGILVAADLEPSAASLVAYEGGARVGDIPLPSSYCD